MEGCNRWLTKRTRRLVFRRRILCYHGGTQEGMGMQLSENIQRLRREGGLSQEQLAEKLGVSRQSVSKWESAGAVPSIDNMVELSRIFGVTVGVLLGAESQAAEGEQDRGPLKDGEELPLEAVRQILSEYTQQQKQREKKHRILLVCLIAVTILAFLTAMLYSKSKAEEMETRINGLTDEINNSVSMQISGIRDDINSQLEETLKQNHVLVDYGYDVTGFDRETGLVTISIRATPKTYRQGMKAEFFVQSRDFGTVIGTGSLETGNIFSCELEAPISDYIVLSVSLTRDGVSEQQMIGNLNDLKSQYYMHMEAFDYVGYSHSAGSVKYSISGEVEIQITPAGEWKEDHFQMNNWPVEGKVEVKKGGKILQTVDVDFSDVLDSIASGEWITDMQYQAYVSNLTVEAKEGQKLIFVVTVTDNYGKVHEQTLEKILE